MVTGQWVWNNGYLDSYFILHILLLVLHDEDELWVGNFAVFVDIEFVNSLLRLFHLKCTVSNNDSFVDFNFSRQELNFRCAVERGFKTIFLSAVEKLPEDKRDAKFQVTGKVRGKTRTLSPWNSDEITATISSANKHHCVRTDVSDHSIYLLWCIHCCRCPACQIQL